MRNSAGVGVAVGMGVAAGVGARAWQAMTAQTIQNTIIQCVVLPHRFSVPVWRSVLRFIR